MRRLEEAEGGEDLLSAVTARGEVVVEGHPVGHIAGFAFLPDSGRPRGRRNAWCCAPPAASLREEMPRRVSILEEASDDRVHPAPRPHHQLGRAPVARLRPGAALTTPDVEVLDSEFLDGAAARAHARPPRRPGHDHRARPGTAVSRRRSRRRRRVPARPLHRLLESGGVVPGADRNSVPPALRDKLKSLGVRAGRFALFVPDLLKPRSALCARSSGRSSAASRCPTCPRPAWSACLAGEDAGTACSAASGWVQAGPVLLRLDIAERVAAELACLTRLRPSTVPPQLGAEPGPASPTCSPAVLRGAGPAPPAGAGHGANQFGPPPPPMISSSPPPPRAGSARRRRLSSCGRTLPSRPWPRCGAKGRPAWRRRSQRLDKWLWCARFASQRSACAEMARERPGAHQPPAYRQAARQGAAGRRADPAACAAVCGWSRCWAFSDRRGPAEVARSLYEDLQEQNKVGGMSHSRQAARLQFEGVGAAPCAAL